MAGTFAYDVFLSHSSKDKPVVRDLAQRLKSDGLRVWLDEWEIRPGDMIGLKIEQGLEQSRVLVLAIVGQRLRLRVGDAGAAHRDVPRPDERRAPLHPDEA